MEPASNRSALKHSTYISGFRSCGAKLIAFSARSENPAMEASIASFFNASEEEEDLLKFMRSRRRCLKRLQNIGDERTYRLRDQLRNVLEILTPWFVRILFLNLFASPEHLVAEQLKETKSSLKCMRSFSAL